jgi:hypothetical protein
MPKQRTLLDGDTGAKFDSLELLVGEASNSAPSAPGPSISLRFTVSENGTANPILATYTSTGGWSAAQALDANFITCSFNIITPPPADMGLCGAFFAGDPAFNVSVVIAVPPGFPGGDVDIWFQAQKVTE